MTFMDAYRAGLAGENDLIQQVAYWCLYVDDAGAGPGLEDYLGMTWAEYVDWALDKRMPARHATLIDGARR